MHMGVRRAVRALAISTVAGVALAACGSSSTNSASSGGGATNSAPGITATTIKLGLLYDVTGDDSAGNNPTAGAVARIDLQNAEGGVNGRKITYVVGDGQSSPTGALNAATELVEQKGVFGIMAGAESFMFGANRYLTQQNVPVAGTGIDGPEWGEKSSVNMFDVLGSSTDSTPFTTIGKFFKSQGCTNVATEAYGTIPGSVAQAKLAGDSASSVGLKNGLNDTTASLTSTDLSSQALNIKRAGADCVMMELAPPAVYALSAALQQNSVKAKATLTPVGYGDVTASSSSAARGVDFIPFGLVPKELSTSATKAMAAALAKYSNYTGSPDISVANGWLSADLMIKSLQLAGPHPTRASFEAALHNLTDYNAGGVLADTVNLSMSKQGTYEGEPSAGNCFYVTKYQGTTYQVLGGGKPYCGTAIGR